MIHRQQIEDVYLAINNIPISLFALLEKAEYGDSKLQDNDRNNDKK